MKLKVRKVEHYILNMRTRMPFRYGIATLTALPHLFLRVDVEIDGKTQQGLAADGLPPKWFTKNPQSSVEHDLMEMVGVIRHASQHVQQFAPSASVFKFWKELYDGQKQWAQSQELPPLLAHFGTSLLERAVIDAFCRATSTSFPTALRRNALGIETEGGHIGPPLQSIIARHTVGLGDPLTDNDIPAGERIDDGLPQSLESAIGAYGLTHFKLKLSGDIEKDRQRLLRLASILAQHARDYRFTLDGNENFHALEPFRQLWQSLAADPSLQSFLARLIFVEQPFHRDIALSRQLTTALLSWHNRPPIIIDESDGELSSAAKALDGGYAGTSHKNCKGIFKGIATARLIAQRHKSNPHLILSGEDLANVGPIALFEDLAVMAALGIEHVERNGHHYFRGLSMFPEDVQADVLRTHGDLYRRHERGFATLRIAGGRLDVSSVLRAPFGYAVDLDVARFTPLEKWTFASLTSTRADLPPQSS